MPLRHRLNRLIIAGTTSLAALTLAAGLADAAPGYVTQNINMRAGPDVSYPLVASLPEGTQVEIYGCLQGWSWCDTQAGDARGWVAGVGLQVVYDQEPEPLVGYGEAIGLPFIGFNFDNYWGSYYRGRPWYSNEDRWHGGGGFHGPEYEAGRRPDFDHSPGRAGPWQGGPVHGGPNPGFPGGQGGFHGPAPERPPQGAPGGQGGFRGPGPGGAPGRPMPGGQMHGEPGGEHRGPGGPPAGGGDHRGPGNPHPN